MRRLGLGLLVLALAAALPVWWMRSEPPGERGEAPRAAEAPAQPEAPAPARVDAEAPPREVERPPEEYALRFRTFDAETGEALADVRIEKPDGLLLGVTGPDGRLSAVECEGAAFGFVARRRGYDVVKHWSTDPEVEMRVELPPAILSVAGRVLWRGSAAPVPGADVRVWAGDEEVDEISGTMVTDAEGRFELAGAPAGRPIRVLASVPGCAPGSLDLTVTETVADLELLVGGGGTLEGSVTVHGSPAAGHAVFVLRPGGEPMPQEYGPEDFVGDGERLAWFATPRAVADDGGRYRIEGLPVGQDLLPVLRVADGSGWNGEPVRFERDGEVQRRDIVVPAAPASLRVLAFDAEGRPVGEFQATLEGGAVRLQRDADDGHLFGELPPGSYTLRVRLPARPVREQTVELAPGEARVVEIRPETGLTLEGVVVTPQGEPVPWAQVYFNGKESVMAEADESGSFRFEGLSARPGVLSAHISWGRMTAERRPPPMDEFARARLPGVAPGRGPLRVVLTPGARVSGRLVGIPKGQRVGVHVGCASWSWGSDRLSLHVGGRFEVPVPSEEPLAVTFQVGGKPYLVAELETIEPGGARDLGDLRLASPRAVRGRVVGPDGAPVNGAKIRVAEYWAGHDRSARTDRAGWFRLDGMPRKPLHLVVDAKGHPRHLFDHERDGDTLALGGGGVLRGSFHGAEGRMFLRVEPLAPRFHDVYETYRAAADKPFSIRVQEGAYRLDAWDEDRFQWTVAEAAVRLGETTEIELRRE